MKVFYNDNYVNCDNNSETTRKSQHIAASIDIDPIPGSEIYDPLQEVDLDIVNNLIRSAHSKKYVNAVIDGNPYDLAESNGLLWDPNLYTMASNHIAGMVAATTDAMQNGRSISLSSGLHHASKNEGAGFCTFNGVAISAMSSMMMGAEKVLILDFDAHCGGGTYDILGHMDNILQTDVYVSSFDIYEDFDNNFLVDGNYNYLEAIEFALAESTGDWDFIVYNAGVDPVNCGVSFDEVKTREELVSDFVKDTPCAISIAGGYTWGGITMEEIVDLHRNTIVKLA